MKIKEGYMVREVAGSNIVVPVGDRTIDFNGIITLNDTAMFLWKLLEKGAEKEDILKALLNEYDIDNETASSDIDNFLKKLEDADIIE